MNLFEKCVNGFCKQKNWGANVRILWAMSDYKNAIQELKSNKISQELLFCKVFKIIYKKSREQKITFSWHIIKIIYSCFWLWCWHYMSTRFYIKGSSSNACYLKIILDIFHFISYLKASSRVIIISWIFRKLKQKSEITFLFVILWNFWIFTK